MDQYFRTDKKVENGEHFIHVYTRYNKGDTSNAYHPTPRGYSVHVQPVILEKRNGYTSERYLPTHGYRNFILPVERKSDKAERQADEIAAAIWPAIVDRVCMEEGCKIAEVRQC